MLTKKEKSRIGKRSRNSGARFELKVRKNLEDKGWIVSKWMNNVELKYDLEVLFKKVIKGKLIPAKHKFRGKGIPMAIGTGFPDYICFRGEGKAKFGIVYNIIGVECKSLGYLDKEEKAKCEWLLKNKVFSRILIASRGKKRGTIRYREFE